LFPQQFLEIIPYHYLLQISEEEQNFILQFFFFISGSLKEMASQMGMDYPTVRNKLDDIISKLIFKVMKK
jgi:hypothetical protein